MPNRRSYRHQIISLVPNEVKSGETVTMTVAREVITPKEAVVLVDGKQAVVKLVRSRSIVFTAPASRIHGPVPVIVRYRGEDSPPAWLIMLATPPPTTSTTRATDTAGIVAMPSKTTGPPTAARTPRDQAPTLEIFSLVGVIGMIGLLIVLVVRLRSRPDEKLKKRIVREHLERVVKRPDTETRIQPDRGIPQPAPPAGLVRMCADGECVLFAGQGLDLIAGYRPLPDVLDELIREAPIDPPMRSRLQHGLLRGETEAVLDILLATDAAHFLLRVLKRSYRDLPPDPGVLEALRVIDFAGILTTSWTQLLPHIFRMRNPVEVSLPRAENVSALLETAQFAIVRLFGRADVPDPLILTATEMRQIIRRNDFLSKYLTSLLSTRPHLFIGVNGDTIDDYFSALQWGPAAGRHFAVLEADSKTELDRERLKARYGIEVIETPPTAGLEATRTFVEELAQAVRADKASSLRQRAADVPTLRRLVLQNIGAFRSLDLTLSPGWNVILGNNASGKTTILRAIAAALCGDDPRAAVAAERLLHAGASSGFVELTIGGDIYRAELIRELKHVRVVNRQLTPLQTGKALVLGFPAIRGIGGGKEASSDSSGDILPSPDVSDILPLLTGNSDSRTDRVKQWLIDLESRRLRAGGESWRLAELRNKFFELLNVFTPGLPICFANVDFEAKQVFVKAGEDIIPLDYVSQGMISVVAWIGTLLQRMYAVRARSEDPTKEPAIVLIDELDAHLHPEWQQEIVARLKEQFPNVQFIATTHSSLVVAGLRRTEVFLASRDLEDTSRISVVPSPIHFEGLRADQILTSPLFGLSSTRGPHVDRYSELLTKRDRTPEDERELEILRGSIAETDEVLKTRRLRHALDELASEKGFEALLAGEKIAPEVRERLLAAIAREDRDA